MIIRRPTLALALGLLSSAAVVAARPNARLRELVARAEAGDVEAQSELCRRYDSGDGVKPDGEAAVAWCRRAAEQGDAESQNALGSMYMNGENVPLDDAQARAWLELAAAQDQPDAITSLGFLHDLGRGVPEDDVKAVALYRRAVALGDPSAMLNLGIMLFEGTGVARDPVDGFAWMEVARVLTASAENMRVKWRIRGACDEYGAMLGKSQHAAAGKLANERLDAVRRTRR